MVRVRRDGTTLIDLLVVVFVIAILAVLLLPALRSSREAARRMQCLNNLKQVGLAMLAYHDGAGVFPPGYGVARPADVNVGVWGWGAILLPWIDERPLYGSLNLHVSAATAANRTAIETRVTTYLCPTSGDARPAGTGFLEVPVFGFENLAPSQYVASAGSLSSLAGPGDDPGVGDGVFFENSGVGLRGVADGASSTLLVGERSRDRADAVWVGLAFDGHIFCTNEGAPTSACDSTVFRLLARTGPDAFTRGSGGALHGPYRVGAGPDGFASRHPGVRPFSFVDGAARVIRNTVAPEILRALASRAGAEIVPAF